MRKGRSSNLGHTVAALERLDAMPLEPLLLNALNSSYLEENLERLKMRYKPGITYGQAARDADRRLRSNAAADQEEGAEIGEELKALFYTDYEYRKRGLPFGSAAPQKITALHKTRLANRSLSARLAHAGISEISESHLPLSGDNLEDVFQGLIALVGTDVPIQGFYQEGRPWIMSHFGSKMDEWDGSFDALIHCLCCLCEEEKKINIDEGDCVGVEATVSFDDIDEEGCIDEEVDFDYVSPDTVLWWLLIEPFCLLEQARKLKEDRNRLLECFQVWNESLRQELEGMNFDGNVH